MSHSITSLRRLVRPGLLAVVLVIAGSTRPAHAASAMAMTRFAGADRYATAAAISAASFAPGVDAVYIAVGADFPDALWRGCCPGPGHGCLRPAQRHPERGGRGTDPPQAGQGRHPRRQRRHLERCRSGPSRLHSGSRFGRLTALARLCPASAAISAATFKGRRSDRLCRRGSPTSPTPWPGLLLGHAAPDPARGADLDPGAHRHGVEPGLAPAAITVLGGPSAVSSGVVAALGHYTTGAVKRLAGANRYATAVVTSAATYPRADTVYLAWGRTADTLAGASLGGPLPS